MNKLDFINEISTSTTVKNAVDFNYRTHLRMARMGLVSIEQGGTAYEKYPPVPSRRILNSRSTHYPFLQHIYKDLPSRLMFYIPRIHKKLLRRQYIIQRIYTAAYSCIHNYMKVQYKFIMSNNIVAKNDLHPENYHSKLSLYMPDYYYIYKATQFDKYYAVYNTKNNFHHNNYFVMYLLAFLLVVLYPVYQLIYEVEGVFLLTISDHIKLLFLPNYLTFTSALLSVYGTLIHSVVTIFSFLENLINQVLFYSPIYLERIYLRLIHIICISYYYFGDNYIHDSRFWREEGTVLLSSVYEFVYGGYYYFLTIVFHPLNTIFSLIIMYCSDLRMYYIMILPVVFYSIIRHGSGGFNQVLKDYVGTRTYFYSYYFISIYLFLLYFVSVYFNVYGEEPLAIVNFAYLDTYLITTIVSFFKTILVGLDSIVTTILYHSFFKYLIHV